MRSITRSLAPALALAMVGCLGAHAIDGDAERDGFGGAFAKADGRYSLCELRKVLELVNRSDSDRGALEATLAGISTRGRAAANIVAHRDGPDGVLGTADDDLFDDLDELDQVPFVGPVTLERFVNSIEHECAMDLSARPFIDATTFSGNTGGGWTRDNVELEATYALTGATGRQLRSALLTERGGDTIFEDITENGDLEAFTYGYDPDEMPWNRSAHRIRERMPYVMLTIESGRFEPDARDGVRELSLGTDIMDDTYFDTQGFDLVHRDLVLRGRARWDTPDEIRRLLIAAKEGGVVGADGIKRAAKVDVRRDFPSVEQIGSLEFDVMRGQVAWQTGDTPIEPVRVIYSRLREEMVLPDIDGYEDVLLLHPMAHLRSTRSRFHFNEARLAQLRTLHALGAERIEHAVEFAELRLQDADLDSADRTLLEELAIQGRALLDGTALAERANADLAAAGLPAGFDAASLPRPQTFGRASTHEELEQFRVVAEAISAAYHDYSDLLDDADRVLSQATDNDWDDYADYFIAWLRSQDQVLGRTRVVEPYLERFEAMDPGAELPRFNQWVAAERDGGDDDFEDFVEIDATGWARMGDALVLEMLKIHQRQIESAGTVGRALWFDGAREFYVPDSVRRTSNFLIDTTDMTDMVSHTEWLRLTPTQRRIDRTLPAAAVFHTAFVNEVQIELGSETAYVERIQALRELVEAGSGTDEDRRALEGATWVFEQYRGALTFLAELKEDRVRRFLRRGGLDDIEWAPAERGKGQTALLLLADEL